MAKVASIRFADLLPLGWSSLKRNRLRSSLTVGAIAFGVSIMVYLVSLGLGLENLTVGNVLRSSTLLSFNVTTFNKDINPLDETAFERIRAIPEVGKVLPLLSVRGDVILVDKISQATIVGVDPEYFAVNEDNRIDVGQPFAEGETHSMLVTTGFLRTFGLLPDKVPQVLYDVRVSSEYGDVPLIEDVNVRGVVNDDAAVSIYLPRQFLESLVENKPDYQEITVLVNRLEDIDSAKNQVISLGFRATTIVDTVDEIKRVFGYIQWTLAVLGAIAIVVASIGMFNTLTVSLLERTREIGIMKALGIKRSDVRRIFLTEALLIGILGGALGLALAFGLQQLTLFTFQLLALIAEGTVPQLFINQWYLPAGALIFSIVIALVTGFYPAGRAAKLNPIDAIRHE